MLAKLCARTYVSEMVSAWVELASVILDSPVPTAIPLECALASVLRLVSAAGKANASVQISNAFASLASSDQIAHNRISVASADVACMDDVPIVAAIVI